MAGDTEALRYHASAVDRYQSLLIADIEQDLQYNKILLGKLSSHAQRVRGVHLSQDSEWIAAVSSLS